jgi:hypothetical protein
MRIARLLTAVGVGAALLGAPVAHADPEDLVPYCSGGQTPDLDNCKQGPHRYDGPGTSGTDPQIGTGTDPGLQPVV